MPVAHRRNTTPPVAPEESTRAGGHGRRLWRGGERRGQRLGALGPIGHVRGCVVSTVVACLLGAAGSAYAQAHVPVGRDRLVGHFTGEGCQASGSCWTIDVVIDWPVRDHFVTGRIAYPSLRCDARLEFVRWEGEAAVFRERYIRRGNCVPDGWLWLRPVDAQRLDFVWAWPDGNVDPHTSVRRSP
jgi:hypothetical protein